MNNDEPRLSIPEFFKSAVLRLRNTAKSKGIHSVYSGFNAAFRKYYDLDPVEHTQDLANKGVIAIKPVKGGVMIYLPEDAPRRLVDGGDSALDVILGKKNTPPTSGLAARVVSALTPARRRFPTDFWPSGKQVDTAEVTLPPTQLVPEVGSKTVMVSPKRRFRLTTRNPAEMRFILYAQGNGERKVAVPRDNRVLFKMVTAYSTYARDLKERAFRMLVELTHDERVADTLLPETCNQLGLCLLDSPDTTSS